MDSDMFSNACMEYLPAFVVALSSEGEVVYCNRQAEKLFGRVGMAYSDYFACEALIKKISDKEDAFDENINGTWYHLYNTPIPWPTEHEQTRLIVGFDLSGMIARENHLLIVASTDSLTGIYNRQAGLEYFNNYLGDTRDKGSIFTVCYIDINDLKYVNDNFGHAAGDEYIKTVVECIRTSIRCSDIFARMGGDEFLIILPDCRREAAENIMGIVTNKLDFISKSEAKEYSIAYGIMEINSMTKIDADYILNAVDSKMYHMKNAYKRNRIPSL